MRSSVKDSLLFAVPYAGSSNVLCPPARGAGGRARERKELHTREWSPHSKGLPASTGNEQIDAAYIRPLWTLGYGHTIGPGTQPPRIQPTSTYNHTRGSCCIHRSQETEPYPVDLTSWIWLGPAISSTSCQHVRHTAAFSAKMHCRCMRELCQICEEWALTSSELPWAVALRHR